MAHPIGAIVNEGVKKTGYMKTALGTVGRNNTHIYSHVIGGHCTWRYGVRTVYCAHAERYQMIGCLTWLYSPTIDMSGSNSCTDLLLWNVSVGGVGSLHRSTST